MVIKHELARMGDRLLIETRIVGDNGQVHSKSYEMAGPETLYFTDRAEAEAALCVGAGAGDAVAP